MIPLENLANRLAEKLAASLGYDAEKQAVIAYGLKGILQLLVLALLLLVLGLFFSAVGALFTVYLTVALYRKYSGGGHASSMEVCTLFSGIICLLLGLSGKMMAAWTLPLWSRFLLLFLTFAAAFLITFQKAPIDSPNKPIRSPEKRGRMRRGSFLVLAAAFLFAFFFLIRNSGCGYALLLAVLWQAFTLTPPGVAFIGLIDRIFSGKAGRSH